MDSRLEDIKARLRHAMHGAVRPELEDIAWLVSEMERSRERLNQECPYCGGSLFVEDGGASVQCTDSRHDTV